MSKKIYYETVDSPESAQKKEETPKDERGDNLPAVEATEAVAERDLLEELKTAAKNVRRVRYRIVLNLSGRIGAISMFLMAIVLAGSLFIGFSKTDGATIAWSAIVIAAVVGMIALIIISKAEERRPYYCYYARDERGIFCLSYIGDKATVYAYGTAYRIDGDAFYTFDKAAFSTWLEGECSGLCAALDAEKSVFSEGDGESECMIETPEGGSHYYFLSDGRIQKIVSAVPYRTDVIDPKTGEAVVKYKQFTKVDPTENFAWEIPPFIKDAFDKADVPFPDMTGL